MLKTARYAASGVPLAPGLTRHASRRETGGFVPGRADRR